MNAVRRHGSNGFKRVYKLSLFIYVINSMHPWFLLSINAVWISIIFLLVGFFASTQGFYVVPKNKTPIILCSLLFLWIARMGNIFGLTEALINSINIAYLICLRHDLKTECLAFITKLLAIILTISLIAYILFLFKIQFPHSTLDLGESSRKCSLDNYYFFVVVYEVFGSTRFYSIFLEPGYLTLGVAPILFLYKYNIKNKYIAVLLIAQIISFSLAGIILLLFGLLYYILLSKQRGRIIKIFKIFSAAALIVIPLYQFLGEDYFDQTIFKRIQIVDGRLSGDDRSSTYLDAQYDKLISSPKALIGTDFDVSKSEKGVSGYKLFTVENGILGTLLVIITYLSFAQKWYKLDYDTGLLILCLLLLYQNSYPTAICVLFPAICARSVFNKS